MNLSTKESEVTEISERLQGFSNRIREYEKETIISNIQTFYQEKINGVGTQK